MRRLKSKAKSMTDVPQTREAMIETMRQLGSANRMLADICAAADEEARAIAAKRDAETAPLKEQIKNLQAGIQAYAEAHRDELTEGGKVKSHNFGVGVVSWRARPPSVRITGADTVIAACFKLGLVRFLRTKTEINKAAMQEEADVAKLLPGVSIASEGEDFGVEILELGNSDARAA